jgi:hypothetical protein
MMMMHVEESLVEIEAAGIRLSAMSLEHHQVNPEICNLNLRLKVMNAAPEQKMFREQQAIEIACAQEIAGISGK